MEETKNQDATPKSLVCKLAEIVAEVDRVEKRGRNEFHKYDYVKAADLAWAVRKKLSERKVFFLSDVIEHTSERVGDFFLTRIDVLYTFLDGESDQKICFKVPGTGADKGDKGLYKAITGSLKYAIRNAFLVPDDADPEGDATVDKESGKLAAAAVAQAKVAEHQAKVARAQIPELPVGVPVDEHGDFVFNDSPAAPTESDPILKNYKEIKGQKFIAVTWGELECTCWDDKLKPWLKLYQNKPVGLTLKQGQQGAKVYQNIVGIVHLDGKPFDNEAKKLEIQRGEQ